MISTVKLLAIVVVLVGFVGGQQCNELVCPGNGCLTRNSVCDGNNDCPDGRGSYIDETDCSGSNYTCVNDIEIHVDMLCDGMNDCEDNSDENGTLCNGADIVTRAITPTPTTTSTTPSSNSNNDDGYDLVVPRLVLFILIPIFIIMVLIIVLPIIFLCFWRRYKLRNMKYRVRIAENARIRKDTLEQSRLTQGTYRNAYADSSFTTMGQSSPPVPQPQSPVPQWRPPVPPLQSPVQQWQPPVPPLQSPVQQWRPPVPPSQSPVPQWQPPVPPSQSPVPEWRPPAPRSQSPVPRSPAPPPPISRQHKPPAPPPPPDELTPLQSTTDVTIEAQVPPSITGIANRTSTMSGAFDILAAVTAAEAAKRRSTVSGGGGMNPTASKSKLQHSTSSSFHSLGRQEQPITPPSSPPPPPPINGILPPPVAPKPKKQQKVKDTIEEPEDTYEDTIANLEPLYEQIPGDQPEQEGTEYVDVVPPPFVDCSENIYDDDAGIHALQDAEFNVPYDTYNVPTSQPGSYDTYDVPTSQPASPDTCDAPQPTSSDTNDVATSQPNAYDTYNVPASQHAASDVPTSQPNSYDTYDVPASQNASYNASDVPTSQPNSYDMYDVPTLSNSIPPPRPPKPPQNPLDRLVEEQDPINKYDTDQEVCELSEMDAMNQLQVLDLNDND